MAVWRLQVNTGGTNVADYCLKNHVAAMGWSLRELTQAERSGIHTFLDYCNLARTQYKSFDSVCRMVEDVKEGDLLWMRSRNEGKYYIARVKANSTWVFREDAVQMDAANQLTNIDWYPATDKADEESVPGAVATSFIMGSTIQRIKKNGVEEYSQMLYNRVHDSALDLFNYPDPALSLCEKHFYSLLQPEDVEDLLALWLYDTKGYVCIPSTNKIATPKYECVLVDPNDLNRKHIYIQVKKGDVDLNTDDYSSLNGEVYLLTTEGNVQNAQKYSNVKAADPTVIYEFAINPDKSHIIPENVLYWVKFLTEIENNRLKFSACKGIMFDTNISYSDTNESEMILGNKIAAYGKTAKSILISCGARLAVFDIAELREVTAYDELELDTLGDRKTALFLIMSDTDDSFNFLISMCYTQLFNLLCEKADDVYDGRLPVHVRCLIDECANIGQIPKLEKLVATIRSREISACLVLQAQSQLKAIYKDNADTIIGNMDTSIFLGGKEPTTLKELAAVLGKETIDTYNTGESRGRETSHSLNYQKLGKELMSQDELAVMDGGKCILQLRGVRPFLSDKYDITKHPNFKYTADADDKNAFDIEAFLSARLKLKPDEVCDVYEVDTKGT